MPVARGSRQNAAMSARPAPRTPARPAAPAVPALYQQIKDFIVRGIQDGSWRAGDRLPSENELVTRFGMSRMTVNRALRELVEQGRIVRVAGVGSFVAEGKPQSTLLHIANLAEEIRQRGHDYPCEVLRVERVSAPVEVAAALDLRAGASVFHAVCVHREDGVPVQLEDRYVNPRMAPTFGAQDFRGCSPRNSWCATCPSTRWSTWSMPCCPHPSRPGCWRSRPATPACCSPAAPGRGACR